MRSVVGALVAGLVSAIVFAIPAGAEAPFAVEGALTDNAGALGSRREEVESTLARLAAETPLQLLVVYVESFDGVDGVTWTTAAAEASRLGDNGAVLAVAVNDRRWGYSVAARFPLSDEQLAEVASTGVEPALSSGDWAGIAIAAAEGYRTAYLATNSGGANGEATTGTEPATGDDSSAGGALVLIVVAVVVAIALAVAVFGLLRRRRGGEREGDQPPVGPDGRPLPVDAPRLLPTAGLNRRASIALVQIDDAIKTSGLELAGAQAQVGPDAVRGFREVLDDARQSIAYAFSLRQQLDDARPESETAARALMIAIIENCDRLNNDLDAQADEFDEVRDLHARVPDVLGEIEKRAREVAARAGTARVTIDRLVTTYPPGALVAVATNVDLADRLLESANIALSAGRADLEAHDRDGSVAHARVAEDAVAQTQTLLDAVNRADEDLAAAGQWLDVAITYLSADIAEVERLGPDNPATAATATTAREQLRIGQSARSGGDPFAALRQLDAAQDALDDALATVRPADDQAQRVAVRLGEMLGRMASQIRSFGDFIDTRRGAIGAEARTRLAEAKRHLDEANERRTSDPFAALDEVRHAETLVRAAGVAALRDVGEWQRQQRDASALALAGILIEASRRGGPPTPGDGVGFGFAGRGRGPGSFGGRATRGRRGPAARF